MKTLIQAAVEKFGDLNGVRHAIALLKRRQRRAPVDGKKPYLLDGGPYHGNTLWLTGPRTVPFVTPGYRGLYVEQSGKSNTLYWKDLK